MSRSDSGSHRQYQISPEDETCESTSPRVLGNLAVAQVVKNYPNFMDHDTRNVSSRKETSYRH
jgi:hypothetical protein